jgi:hypothetical protein
MFRYFIAHPMGIGDGVRVTRLAQLLADMREY